MPYIHFWLHLIWATKNRQPLISKELKPKLLNHIRENAIQKSIHLDFINGVEDHVHALVSLLASQTIADVVQSLKGESSRWVNKNKLTKIRFGWQTDYMALSVSESHVDRIREYIKSQVDHHRTVTFAEEYQQFLEHYNFEQ
ncbi:MAG: IS200/IS605 family transposase [Candidatus Marinimicrobia bacterium]|nr:IS200/IS605 family transposase [Candidatus Neomarinimicrobiota bacterium]MCF7830051.1 IS200/IS605 family transposase [Candidatus Neomarinimicrobiota bacterium]MCF7882352.1 IS200/IS605 family transposase [Candidatus Neomarinimicrobiota bacterium]